MRDEDHEAYNHVVAAAASALRRRKYKAWVPVTTFSDTV